jgi:hypothetical protein
MFVTVLILCPLKTNNIKLVLLNGLPWQTIVMALNRQTLLKRVGLDLGNLE